MAGSLSALGANGGRIVVFGAREIVGTSQGAIALARALATRKKVVLVDLALRSPNLSVIADDPDAPGLTEAINGTATFGQIIVCDRMSSVHVIQSGRVTDDVGSILHSPYLVVALEALALAYDHVIVDAGTVTDLAAERLARITEVAVLACERADDPATGAALAQIDAGGFKSVRLMSGASGPTQDEGAGRSRAAA